MSEGWFYRETAGAREIGPVTKSDIEYLRTQGTIRPGMEIRSEFGEWSAVSSGSGIKSERREPSAAALPRVANANANAATVLSPTSDSPPVPPPSKVAVVRRNSNKQIAIAAGVIGASALLIFLLLTATNGTGIESNAGLDVVDGSEEKQISTVEPASIPAGQPSGSDNGDSAATSDATPDVQGSNSVASGNQPVPLNRNVNREHVISPGAEFLGVRATTETMPSRRTAKVDWKVIATTETMPSRRTAKVDLQQSDMTARSGKRRQQALEEGGGTAESEQAVALALKWLKARQQANGSWDFREVGLDAQPGTLDSNLGATAMAMLCFLGAGNTTRTGPEKDVVKKHLITSNHSRAKPNLDRTLCTFTHWSHCA